MDIQVTTDSLGHFLIDSLPSSVYRASVWASGYDTTKGVLFDLWGGETASQEIVLNEKNQI